MVRRTGVGASVASAVIFAVLLASSFTVYHAAQENVRLHAIANAEDSLADSSAAFAGAGAMNILLKEQAFLQSNEFDCRNASAVVMREVGTLADVQESENLTVVTSASPADGGAATNNLSMLAPFGGYVPGAVDTALHQEESGNVGALEVSYARNETRYVNIPARLGEMAADCAMAASAIAASLSASNPGNCTATAVDSVVSRAAEPAREAAEGTGFGFSVEAWIIGLVPCSVEVVVLLSQPDVLGPAGSFSVRMQEELTVDFG